MTTNEFKKILKEKPEDEKTAQFYLGILKQHFIPDWYSTSGFVCNADINPEIVFEILKNTHRKGILGKGFLKHGKENSKYSWNGIHD